MAKFLAKTLAKRNNFYAQSTEAGLLSKNSCLAVQLKCGIIHDSQCSEFGHIKISGMAAALSVTKLMTKPFLAAWSGFTGQCSVYLSFMSLE
jgi:hypothetical protein